MMMKMMKMRKAVSGTPRATVRARKGPVRDVRRCVFDGFETSNHLFVEQAPADVLAASQASEKGAKSFGIRNANKPPKGAVPYDFPDIFSVSPEEYFELTMQKFPAEGIADVQQARVLYSTEGGYHFLDVRSTPELDDGKIPGAFHCPLIEAKKKWDSDAQDTVMIQTPNPDFLNQVQKQWPDKNQPILIGCSDSRDRAIQVLELLDGLGYTCIVGLRGGCSTWLNTFDNKLGRRRKDGYTEVATAEGTTGIFGTRPGAGWCVESGLFSQGGLGKDKTEWLDWAAECGGGAAASQSYGQPAQQSNGSDYGYGQPAQQSGGSDYGYGQPAQPSVPASTTDYSSQTGGYTW